MDKVIKKKWVYALRSGKYKQAQKRLHISNLAGGDEGFCCLGVVCAVADGYIPGGIIKDVDYSYDRLEKLGIDSNIQDILITMNDKANKSFEEIATCIEESL